jgi:hypothetical protein
MFYFPFVSGPRCVETYDDSASYVLSGRNRNLVPRTLRDQHDKYIYKVSCKSKTIGKSKLKQSRYTPWRRLEERRYIS